MSYDSSSNYKYPKQTPKRVSEEVYPLQNQPLFPRETLEPLFEKYIHDHPPYDKARHDSNGFFKFLLEQPKPEKEISFQKIYIDKLEKSIDELVSVINQFIDIADNPNSDDKINLAKFVGWAIVAKKQFKNK